MHLCMATIHTSIPIAALHSVTIRMARGTHPIIRPITIQAGRTTHGIHPTTTTTQAATTRAPAEALYMGRALPFLLSVQRAVHTAPACFTQAPNARLTPM